MEPKNTPGAQPSTEASSSSSPAAAEATAAQDPTHEQQSEEAGCPICQFIEAGPCGDQHKVWVSCRNEAKQQDVDFVQHCADNFRAFFGCMLAHQDYYQPFLEATGVDVERSQEAIDTVKDKQQGQKEQQQRQQDGAGSSPAQGKQQQQQQPPR